MMIMGISGLTTLLVIDTFSAKTTIATTRMISGILWATIAICGAIRSMKK